GAAVHAQATAPTATGVRTDDPLVVETRRLWDAGQFDEAQALVQKALAQDPANETAALLARILGGKRAFGRDYVTVSAAATAPAPRAPVRPAPEVEPPDTVLDDTLKEIAADGQSLEKVLMYLSASMGCKIAPDWPALQKVGIDQSTPVTLSARDI